MDRVCGIQQDGDACEARNHLAQQLQASAGQAADKRLMPVMFPPGRLRLETKPLATGSPLIATIGTVCVAFFRAASALELSVTMASTRNRTHSAASLRKSS